MEAELITDLATLESWRSPQSIKPSKDAKAWARKTFDVVAFDRALGAEPYVLTRDGRAARIAKNLVVDELRATGVLVWRGTGDAATTGVPLTKLDRAAVPRLARWRAKLPDALRPFVVRFRDGAVVMTATGPHKLYPAEWMYRQWYLAVHAPVVRLES